MKEKFIKHPQLNVFQTPLVSIINMDHELVLLANRIDWKSVDKEFPICYPYMGRPAVPIRKMVGSMILKQMYNLGDETFVARWIEQRFREHPKKRKKANAAARKFKTIAVRLVRDVERGLDDIDRLNFYDDQLWLYYRVLGQKKDDNNKLYSFHAPEVKCISKGKEHKRYEFGNKSSFVLTKKSGIVVGAMAFEDNIYDGHTLEPQLAQVEDLLGRLPETALVDRGCKGRKHIMGVNIKIPGSGKGKSAYQKAKDRERFRRRASIEPIIGHLKQDHRVLRNYLKGVEGDMINTILAGAAFNMMKMLRKIRESIICVLNELIKKLTQKYRVQINYC